MGKLYRKVIRFAFSFIVMVFLTNNKVFASGGSWIRSGDQWWYKHSDGSYTVSDWEYIDGKWYHFDSEGWMETGWIFTGGYYYLLTSSGDMNTDIYSDSNATYRFRGSGELVDTRLHIIRERQENTNWCWAASSAVVAKYKNDTGRTQESIVMYVKGQYVNEGGSSNEEGLAIQYASEWNKNAYRSSILTFDEIVERIDQQKPILMNVKWLSNDGSVVGWLIDSVTYSGHAVVIAGYQRDERRIWIMDPWGNSGTAFFSYSGMINGQQIVTGYGRYYDSVIY